MDNVAAVMIVVSDGLILSVSRRNNKTRFGLAGGKANENETPEDCAKRECAEETGINVKTCVPIFQRTVLRKTQDGDDFVVHCFYATEWSGEAKSIEDGIDVKWISKHDLITGPDNGGKGAFPEYNTQSLAALEKMFPDIKLNQTKPEYFCKNCKRPIKSDVSFCEDLSDRCWKEWCVRQRMPKMPTKR